MNQNLKWKMLFILLIVFACLWGLFARPSFPTSWRQVAGNFHQRIKLGLDLQGGTHLVLQVDVAQAVRYECNRAIDGLTGQIRTKNIKIGDIRRVSDTQILVTNVDLAQTGSFHDIVTNQLPEWNMAPAAGQNNGFMLTMKPAAVAAIQSQTMQQSVDTIRRRVDQLGLTEPTIALTGAQNDQILVELPGEGDPTQAKAVIQAGGQLELRKVIDGPYPSEAEALASHGGILPAGSELLPGSSDGSASGQAASAYYLVTQDPVVTGRDLRSATAGPNANMPGQWQVNFTLSRNAAQRFGPFTERNIGQRLAIVLDHRVQSAPVIQGQIQDSGEITGSFTEQQASDLAVVLRSGALPASIKYIEESTVGPSLGADSIREGVQASIISLVAVMIFLLIYYRLSGVNAVLALILNLVILLAGLAYFGFVLTLPGIAGVILTIGMGVDSNVLVFERIREELRAGKANASAVDLGFERAFLTIIDTHVTTMVSAIFLFMFGTGPVRGFAITLVIGLSANIFTSIYVSRAIFDWHLSRMTRQAELSI
ncbi:MAG TPA: protein translocase subunit SecD [Candidatus Dormibacteraeota bacterium]|nr:protein translocase subunit SecD [Candidatus Dormibacteraeota bacterium]